MTKENKLEILRKDLGIENSSIEKLQAIIDNLIMDELKYAGIKAAKEHLSVEEEFNKVLEAYKFEGYFLPTYIKNYIKHYSLYPELASQQHYSINEYILNIGEHYDGESAT